MDIIFNKRKTVSFVADVEKAVLAKETIVIHTKLEFEELFNAIGKGCAKKCGYQKMIDAQLLTGADDGIYTFIGQMIINNLIPDDYFIVITDSKGKRVCKVEKGE